MLLLHYTVNVEACFLLLEVIVIYKYYVHVIFTVVRLPFFFKIKFMFGFIFFNQEVTGEMATDTHFVPDSSEENTQDLFVPGKSNL